MRPRSNGCRVCVSRRVRCDLGRPSCRRCKIAGRMCDGYGSNFIAENPGGAKDNARLRDRANESDGYRAVGRLGSVATLESSTRSSRSPDLLNFSLLSITTAPPYNYNEDFFCKFFLDQTYSFGTWDHEMQANRRWMLETLQHPSQNSVSLPALRCLIIGFFGHTQRNVELKTQAAKLYTQAIIALKNGLESESARGSQSRPFPSFQLLSATMLLLQYEYLAVTPPKGWIRHASGLETLIKLRGPDYFRPRGSRQRALLVRAKMSLQLESMRAYKKSFLDDNEWKALWTNNDTSHEQQHSDSDQNETSEGSVNFTWHLTDITAGLGAVFGEVTRLKDLDVRGKDIKSELSLLSACRESLIAIEHSLRRWWESRSSYSKPVRKAVEASGESSISTFSGNFFTFASLVAAHDFCRYHAYNILIVMWLNRIRSLMPATSSSSNNGSILSKTERFPSIATPAEYASADHPEVVRILGHARAICDALPMYTLPQYRYIGGLWAAFPARIAWQVFPPSSKEALWVKDLLERVADASGFELNRYVCQSL